MALRAAASGALRRASLASSSSAAQRGFASVSLPDLPYDYSALEPVISAQIMELHHAKHHQAYVTNFNKSQEQYAEAEAKGDLATMIALQGALKFNGGGHVNHSIFWTNLVAPKDYELPSGAIKDALEKEFGSVDAMVAKFNAAAAGVQGSGWGWLGYDKAAGRVVVATTANQDPLSTKGLVPLLGVDVWEHAYYLQYKNVRPDYLKEVWKVVNWKNVGERLAAAQK